MTACRWPNMRRSLHRAEHVSSWKRPSGHRDREILSVLEILRRIHFRIPKPPLPITELAETDALLPPYWMHEHALGRARHLLDAPHFSPEVKP